MIPMKILMATWEFPPNKVGGIASHCLDLSKTLVNQGHDVHVLTHGPEEKSFDIEGVHVYTIPSTGSAPDIVSWAMFLSHRMEKKAVELNKEEKFELVHAHDWMMVPAGVGIKKTLNIPMVFTIHSTEQGRFGIGSRMAKMINDLEWYGTYEADHIITVGKDFYNEVRSLFNPPENKMHYIPNGIDIERFDTQAKPINKNDFAADWEDIILFVGRLTRQKGLEYLIYAAPDILKEHGEAKFVIVGKGNLNFYRSIASKVGVANKMFFTGFLEDGIVLSLFKQATTTVIPSIYEPFGIVALEAAAGSRPSVGSYTGGLKETIVHEETGLHTYPGHSKSIADQVNRILSDKNWANHLGRKGRARVEKNYKWDKIARWTAGVYGKALGLW